MSLKPCGTRAAYQRHKSAGEQPCQPCRDANLAYIRARNARSVEKRRADWRLRARAYTALKQRHEDEWAEIFADFIAPHWHLTGSEYMTVRSRVVQATHQELRRRHPLDWEIVRIAVRQAAETEGAA